MDEIVELKAALDDNLQAAYGRMFIAEQVLDMIYNNEKTEIALLFDIKRFMQQVMDDNQKLVDDILADIEERAREDGTAG